MSKHTPGPWICERDMIGVANERHPTVVHNLVSVVMGQDGKMGDEFGDESACNARLIAAAPDLLAACKELITNHEMLQGKLIAAGVLPQPDPEGPYMLAKAAVEKAEPGWVPEPNDEEESP